jgi:hypothetical protein
MASKANKSEGSTGSKGAKRGTSNELEVIKLIIEEHQYIKKMVLDAMKKYERESKETVFDKVNMKLNNAKKKAKEG